MNVTDLDSTIQIDAKLCGSFQRRKIAYSIMDYHHSLYINKKDIILGQIHACELLYKYTIEDVDKNVLKKELTQERTLKHHSFDVCVDQLISLDQIRTHMYQEKGKKRK